MKPNIIKIQEFTKKQSGWIQGKFFGANKTWEDRKQSNVDMIVSIVAGTLGMIVYFLFN